MSSLIDIFLLKLTKGNYNLEFNIDSQKWPKEALIEEAFLLE